MKLFEPKTFFIIAIGVVVLTILALLIWLDVSNKNQQETIPVVEDQEEIPITGGKLEEVIPQLNTSQKLVDYLNENFELIERGGETALTPQDFFEQKKGNVQDFASFAAYVLLQHDYYPGVIKFHYDNERGEKQSYVVTVFRDIEAPRYITITEKGVEMFYHGWSFNEVCIAEEERLGIQIYEYAFFPAGITDFSQLATGYEWIKR